MTKTVIEAAEEVYEALAPMPYGYYVYVPDDGTDTIIVTSGELCFHLTPLAISQNKHVKVAKEMYPQLIMASPVMGNA